MHPTLAAQQAVAARRLPAAVWQYFAAGAGEEVTAGEAERSWKGVRLRPRVLRDVSHVDPGVELLGTRLSTPVLAGPTAAHALAHPEGEPATARGVRAAGSLLVLSTWASLPLEQVPCGPWWFQAYVMRDRGRTLDLVQRAAAAGASAVVLTGDVPYLGARPGLSRLDLLGQGDADPGAEQDPSAGLETIEELSAASGLPVLVKGVLRGDDATACLDAGAAGVVVSNHGGRQLDRAVSSAAALPEVAQAVAGRGLVLVDGGIRSGLDVLCALALGARAVLLGRPILWALSADGAGGVEKCLTAMTSDLTAVMALAGARCPAEVTSDLVRPP